MPALNLTVSGFMAVLISHHAGHDLICCDNILSRNLLTRTDFLYSLNSDMTQTDANRIANSGGNACFFG